MNLGFATPAAVSYGLATLAFVIFSVHLSVGRRGGLKANLLLSIAAITALWSAFNLAYALTGSGTFWVAQSAFDGLRIGTWLIFGVAVLGWASARRVPLMVALVLVGSAVLTRQSPPPGLGLDAFPSQATFGLVLLLVISGLVVSEQIFRRAGPQGRWGIKPLCLGLGGSLVFDLYVYADALLFGRLDADLWAARGLAQTLVIPFIAVATARNKDWTVDIAISRGVIFHSTAFLASGIYLLTVAGAGYYVRYFGGSWGKTIQVGFIFAAVLVLGWVFSSGTIRAKLRVFINKHFFSYRYDYREEWLRFTSLLSRTSGATTAQRSIEALANLVESPAGALWLRDSEGNLVRAGRWNLPDPGEDVPGASSLALFLERTGWVVNIPEYRADPSTYADLRLPSWLTELASAWLVIPVVARDELIGLVVLAVPRTAVEVNWEVRDLLKTAARQVGSFLAQIQASEALMEARKFEAFNKMGAFVVHDLKNLIAQLSLLLKNAERHRLNPRFQEDMLITVRHVAERMNKLLLQLSTGNRGEEALKPVNLAQLAERVVQDKTGEGDPIAVSAIADVMALGHEQRLERVVGHLVQNALDATRGGGKVELKVLAEGACAVLEVQDTGCGMSETFLRERLFRPFETTKSTGMGIGAYETAQYVKELGGRIDADSRPGAGTCIKVMLPLHQEQARAAA